MCNRQLLLSDFEIFSWEIVLVASFNFLIFFLCTDFPSFSRGQTWYFLWLRVVIWKLKIKFKTANHCVPFGCRESWRKLVKQSNLQLLDLASIFSAILWFQIQFHTNPIFYKKKFQGTKTTPYCSKQNSIIYSNVKERERQKGECDCSVLTEIIAEVECLSWSPRGVVRGGCVGRRVEQPPGGAADRVVVVPAGWCGGRGGGGDESKEGREVRRDGRRHGRWCGWRFVSKCVRCGDVIVNLDEFSVNGGFEYGRRLWWSKSSLGPSWSLNLDH